MTYDTDGKGELDFDQVTGLVKDMLRESNKKAYFSLANLSLKSGNTVGWHLSGQS